MASKIGKDIEHRLRALKKKGKSAFDSGYNTAINDAIKTVYWYLGKEINE